MILRADEEVSPQWQSNYDTALAQAKETNKQVLMYFSGSDWCRPCIMLKKKVFETAEFTAFADERFVLLQLDFPSHKKNELPEAQRKHNEKLAERFNTDGAFPNVVILDKNETVVGNISGYRNESVADYLQKLQEMIVETTSKQKSE